MSYAIETDRLVKRFGDVTALDRVDLAVPHGKILGLLGPNGAGKTTIIRILATLLRPEAGSATVEGIDVVQRPALVRRQIGLTGQYATVDEDLTGWQNLMLIARLLGMRRQESRATATALLRRVGLDEAARRRVSTYSGGMRRRLDLAAGLAGRPRVLFLDEPTTGLDPGKREDLWRMIRELSENGTTILLTTQYLEEADALADEIAVIAEGRLIAHDTPAGLKQRVGGRTLTVRPTDPRLLSAVAAVVERTQFASNMRLHRHTVSVSIDDEHDFTDAVRRLEHEGIAIDEIALQLPSLDDAFAALTGSGASRPESGKENRE
jgi:oleandomycin transport system ATP-binding protein